MTDVTDSAAATDVIDSDAVVVERKPVDEWGDPQWDGHLLEVKDLHVEFRTNDGIVNAVNGVTYELDRGETLAILGESGSGKSVSAQAIMGIIDSPPGFITKGEILFRGRDLLKVSEEQHRQIRGAHIAMIFQDSLTGLNPVYSVGSQIAEMYKVHTDFSSSEAKDKAIELMRRVRIPSAEKRYSSYPHEFSGGMRQRVMIAVALTLDPDVLIADEPTTALDVTVQAQIMDLLVDLQQETHMGLILITHDLSVVAEVADRVLIMYGGQVVEKGSVYGVYGNPAHPYTRGLMASVPRIEMSHGGRLDPIRGSPPNMANLPSGCAFHPRCPHAQPRCTTDVPVLHRVGDARESACLLQPEVTDGA